MSKFAKEFLYWIVILIITLIGFQCLCGCAIVDRIGDVLNPGTEQVIPELPKTQMWQTIKSLTPNWLAIPVIALGAVAVFNGARKLGMSFIIFGSVNLFMALATSRFGFWMALCGLIGSMAAVAASIVAKNKAVKELIFGAQKLKDQEWEIGKDFINSVLSNEQTKTTKKIVQKIKTKAKLKGKL